MTTATVSNWRFFPWIVCLGLGGVAAVNGVMAWRAFATHPGVATQAMFDSSNRYDAVLEAQRTQTALGWALGLDSQERRPVVTLADAEGRPLEGARVEGLAQRPAGGAADVTIAFRAIAPGRYLAERALPEPGQWEILLSASASGRTLRATRRVLLP